MCVLVMLDNRMIALSIRQCGRRQWQDKPKIAENGLPRICGGWVAIEWSKRLDDPLRRDVHLRFAEHALVAAKCHFGLSS
jgi:hypothetical protein